MSLSILRKYRLLAGLTQAHVAKEMGVSQPNYQRWESGAADVPVKNRRKLAKILKASLEEIEGKPLPFDYLGYDRTISAERSYYGEVAVHFSGKAEPILFSISHATYTRLHSQLQSSGDILVSEDLENRIFFIRRSSIADLYFSSEAYDDYGPEVTSYDRPLGAFPDDDFWEIVEFMESPEYAEEDYGVERVNYVLELVCLTDEKLNKLVENGEIEEADRENVKKEADEVSKRFYSQATEVSWQLSSGIRRQECVSGNENIYDAFSSLENLDDNIDSLIYLPAEGYHRSIYINLSAIDFISVPAHKFRAGRLDMLEKELD